MLFCWAFLKMTNRPANKIRPKTKARGAWEEATEQWDDDTCAHRMAINWAVTTIFFSRVSHRDSKKKKKNQNQPPPAPSLPSFPPIRPAASRRYATLSRITPPNSVTQSRRRRRVGRRTRRDPLPHLCCPPAEAGVDLFGKAATKQNFRRA